MNLTEVLQAAEVSWPFNEASYPGYAQLSPDEQLLFAVRHILLHQGVALGRLATAIEPAEHGRRAALGLHDAQLALKSFVRNTVRLAALLGVSGEALESIIIGNGGPHQPGR